MERVLVLGYGPEHRRPFRARRRRRPRTSPLSRWVSGSSPTPSWSPSQQAGALSAARGVGPGDHVGLYAKNSIEHVIALLAVLKIRAVTINVNYRYVAGELDYLFDNADLMALVLDRVYAPLVAEVRPEHAQLQTFVVLPDPIEPDDEAATSRPSAGSCSRRGRRADRPPATSRSAAPTTSTSSTPAAPPDTRRASCGATRTSGGCSAAASTSTTGEPLRSTTSRSRPPSRGLVTFPLSPLMHGGAQASLLMHLFAGHLHDPGAEVRPGAHLGDHRPRTGAHDVHDRRRDGATADRGLRGGQLQRAVPVRHLQQRRHLQQGVKERWMAQFPNAVFTDSIGSSETGFQGTGLQDASALSTDGPVVSIGPEHRGHLRRGPRPRPGEGRRQGRPHRTGRERPGRLLQGPREVRRDLLRDRRHPLLRPGRLRPVRGGQPVTLLGRGSNCVNTGGEKVYPEEVEMAIKGHPAVYDVLWSRHPDEKYGQAVAAVVQPREGRPSSSRSCATSCARTCPATSSRGC